MIKKTLNQNAKYAQEFMKTIETDFIFSDKPINRFKVDSAENKETSISKNGLLNDLKTCLLYTSPSPRDATLSRMPSSA